MKTENEETAVNATPPPAKTKRQTWEENMRAKYPGIEDEDALYGTAMDSYDAEHDANKRYTEDNKRAFELLTQNPDVANFIGAILSGESLPNAMVQLSDLIGLEEGSEEYAAYTQGVENRKAKKTERETAYAKFEENMNVMKQNFQEFAEEEGLSDEDANAFIEDFSNFENRFFNGEFTKEDFRRYYNAFNYDDDMKIAREQGAVDARNEAIVNKRKKIKKGDGLPSVKTTTGAKGNEGTPKSKQTETLDALIDMNERRRF